MAERARAGQLRHRVVIQSPVSKSDFIDSAGTFSDEATVWASVVPLGGREREQADQMYGGVTHKVTVRDPAGVWGPVEPGWRVQHDSRNLNVKLAYKPLEISHWLVLLVEEVA